MPKITHEALVNLLRNAPTLLVDLLWPERQVEARSVHIDHAEFVDLNLAEYRADNVILLGDDPRAPVHAVIGEAQTSINPQKRRRWPAYLANVHARHGCKVDLVVLTLDREVAAWAARPIVLGDLSGALALTPTVIGPDQIPVITDLEVARRSPELAVLSAIAHGSEPGAESIALTALAAAEDLDNDRGVFYADLVLHHLGPAARAILETLMATANYEYQSDFARKYFFQGKAEGEAKGKAEGKAEMLLRMIELKGIATTEDERQRILGCTDDAQLERWAARVLSASVIREILDPSP